MNVKVGGADSGDATGGGAESGGVTGSGAYVIVAFRRSARYVEDDAQRPSDDSIDMEDGSIDMGDDKCRY